MVSQPISENFALHDYYFNHYRKLPIGKKMFWAGTKSKKWQHLEYERICLLLISVTSVAGLSAPVVSLSVLLSIVLDFTISTWSHDAT